MTVTSTTTPLRSATSLPDMYRQARAQYDADPVNPAAIRALGWAYGQLLKEASASADATRMQRGLGLVASFPMVDDARWRESILWSSCRFLLRHTPDTLPLGPLANVIVRSAAFVPAGRCLVRSVWWRALLRHTNTGIDWLGLFNQHGWDGGFRPDDEVAEPYGDGQLARPLTEGLIQAVVRQLLGLIVLPDEVAAPWLERLTTLAERHPDWNFLPYYRARLLHRLDRTAEAMAVFLPFARLKSREFWVWSMLAELVDQEQVATCYARALTLGTPETFLVKLRQRVAEWLIGQHRWADARIEIDRLIRTRQENGWPVPFTVQRWTNGEAYTQAGTETVQRWYEPLLPKADHLLWQDVPETVGLVVGVDATGQYASLALDLHTTVSFPVRKVKAQLTPGDKIAIRYTQQEQDGHLKTRIQTAAVTGTSLTHLETRRLTGPLRIRGAKGAGFVGDVYVPAALLTGAALSGDELVRVDAVAAWDTVKQKAGWKAFRISRE